MNNIPNKGNCIFIGELMDEISEGMVLYGNFDRIIHCNQTACKMIGKEVKYVYGRNIREVFPNIDFDQKTQNVIVSLAGHKEKNLEIKLIVPQDKNSSSEKMMILKDITQSTNMKRKLQEAKQKNNSYEVVLNSLDHGIIVINEHGIVTFYNPVQSRTDHMRAEDVIGKHIMEIYRLSDEASFLLKVLKTGKSIDDRQDYITASGRLVNVITTAVPLYKESKIIGAVAITKDFDGLWELFKKDQTLTTKIHGKLKCGNSKRSISKALMYSFNDIVGQNAQLYNAKLLAQNAANSPSPVLIYGETGTGKELFVQSIHQASQRNGKPFIAINCAAIPENLLEGILFGTVPGAFTGAVDRPGLFEQAEEGTVFLDEINSMPITLQAKLLRVIQEGIARRVGGNQDYSIDIRIISTTNEKPMEAIKKNMLRSDLFYRIGVINISIPPLRERKDDLPLLVDYFINKKNEKLNKKVVSNSPEVEAAFLKYDWPGNVRQLEHVIECAMNTIDKESQILIEQLPDYIRNDFPQLNSREPVIIHQKTGSLADELDSFENNRVITALKEAGGNITKAAKQLSLSRQCLQYRMKKFQINIERCINNQQN